MKPIYETESFSAMYPRRGYEALAAAVVLTAVQDYFEGSPKEKSEAEEFLFGDDLSRFTSLSGSALIKAWKDRFGP